MAHGARPVVMRGSLGLAVCSFLVLLVAACGSSKGTGRKDSGVDSGAQLGVGGAGTGGAVVGTGGKAGATGGGGTGLVASGGNVGTGSSGGGGSTSPGMGGVGVGGASAHETGGSKGTGGSIGGGTGGTTSTGAGGAGGAGTKPIDAAAIVDAPGLDTSIDGSNVINCSSGSRCGAGQVPVRWAIPALGRQECTCEPNPCASSMPDCACGASICAKHAATCVGFMPDSGFLQCTEPG